MCPVTLMLRYQSVGNGYQRSYNWLLAFTSEEHVGEQIQLDSNIGWRLDGTSSAKLLALSRHTWPGQPAPLWCMLFLNTTHSRSPGLCSHFWILISCPEHTESNTVLSSAREWPEHWWERFAVPTDFGSQTNQHCERSFVLLIFQLFWHGL